jgi:shikimate kinase
METIPNSSTPTLTLKSPVILVGLMGCGKSALGKRLAKTLSVPFSDSDALIVEHTGKTITQIFSQDGEAYFRELERETLKKLLLQQTPQIIATGGGAFIDEKTRKLMLENSLVIWIKADFPVLLERVSRKKTRPLLEKGDKATILKTLMDMRYPIYEQAHLVIHSTNAPHEVAIKDTIHTIRDFYAKN